MRDGKYVGTDAFRDIAIDDIVSKMVGRALEEKFPERNPIATDTTLLRAAGLARAGVFGPLDVTPKQGEILGFAGPMGAGRTEVARAIFGADPPSSGHVYPGRHIVNAFPGQPVHLIGFAGCFPNDDADQVMRQLLRHEVAPTRKTDGHCCRPIGPYLDLDQYRYSGFPPLNSR
ncbi:MULTISPECIES: hypothetical protein [unclassified Janthinobacterium]|uniref:hypothetical protein n=1 Tax=unclassified Janthinobacterium TaxID=2610881 RepID=UPI000345F1DC|nr:MULTISPECIES: hypothetical protein [unclassified Janthinobacterium]MEC5162725.1 ABC-type uncharacterized transport system ATPase subunit [Janthinobacterium sp. CG_S6]